LNSPAGSEPAGVQWTITYTPSDVTAISAVAGASATAAGKTLTCAPSAGALACIVYGINGNTMSNGGVATISLALAPGVGSTAIGVINSSASDAQGNALTVSASGATVSGGPAGTLGVGTLVCAPTSLASGGVSGCTVTLNGTAPAGGASVTLSSDNPNLTTPGSAAVAAGAVSANFNATAGSFSSAQTANVTASLSGISASAAISLTASASSLGTVTCNSTSLPGGGFTRCAVTLASQSQGWDFVTLTSSNPLLSIPNGTMIGPGGTTGGFDVGVAASVPSDQTATITAAFGGASASINLNLTGPTAVTGLSCTPSSLGPNASTTCTVTLNRAAPAGGVNVILSSNNGALTVPASVSVSASATTTTFSATTAGIPSDQPATLTAAYNGSSASALVNLIGGASVSSLSCFPLSLGSNSSGTCTVTLTKVAPTGGVVVALLTNRSAALLVPATVTVPQGANSATFTDTTNTIASDQSATVTANFNSTTATATINLAAGVAVSAISCSPSSLGPNAASLCTVTLSKAAPAGGATVTISSSNPTLTVPASVTIGNAATSSTFGVSTGTFSSAQSAVVSAAFGGATATATITLAAGPPPPISVTCSATTLSGGGFTRCTATLSSQSAGWSFVTLASSTPLLTIPNGTTIGPGGVNGGFDVAVAAVIPIDQTATITASLNGNSGLINLNLTGGATGVSGVSCNPSSLAQNASSTCTVTLTKAAPAAGTTVTLSSSNASLALPASVTVAGNALTANFSAITGAFSGSQSATVTATLGSSSATTSINLTNSVVPSTVTCTQTTLAGNGFTRCLVTLSGQSAGWSSITLASSSGLVTIPSSTTIGPGGTTGGFDLSVAANVPNNQTVTITASWNGASASLNINLTGAGGPGVTSVVCNPSTLLPNSSANCTVTLTGAAPGGGASVTLALVNSVLSAPGSTTVGAGTTTSNFTLQSGNFGNNQTGTVTASYNGSSQSAAITLQATKATPPSLSSISCAPSSITAGASTTCTITMSNTTGGVSVGVSSNAAGVTVPATVSVAAGAATATFNATSMMGVSGPVQISASYGGVTRTFTLTVGNSWGGGDSGAALSSLACPKSLSAGSHGTCRITLDPAKQAGLELRLASSNPSIRVPEHVDAREGQASVDFQVDAVDAGDPVEVSVSLGEKTVRDTLTVAPDNSRKLRVPGPQVVKFGSELRFQVTAADPAATVSTSLLPAGAQFNAATGEFRWTPVSSQIGAYQIPFNAGDASAPVSVQVDSGAPVASAIVNAASRSSNAACATGAMAAITGRWLAGATRVRANGIDVTVLSATENELRILCPDSVAGSELAFVVETDSGISQTVRTTAASAAPGIFSVDGSGLGQAWAVIADSQLVAMVANTQVEAEPAAPGDRVLIYATGVDRLSNITVEFGGARVAPSSITAVPDQPGMFEVAASVPRDLAKGGDVAVSLSGTAADGAVLRTNALSIVVNVTP
jgi:hypothetical protein